MIQFDDHIFQLGWNHQLEYLYIREKHQMQKSHRKKNVLFAKGFCFFLLQIDMIRWKKRKRMMTNFCEFFLGVLLMVQNPKANHLEWC